MLHYWCFDVTASLGYHIGKIVSFILVWIRVFFCVSIDYCLVLTHHTDTGLAVTTALPVWSVSGDY